MKDTNEPTGEPVEFFDRLYNLGVEVDDRIAQLERVAIAARIILDVAKHAPFTGTEGWLCPHGNAALQGWWCDECFLELADALEAAGVKEGAWREGACPGCGKPQAQCECRPF